jgi:hypothetical protein
VICSGQRWENRRSLARVDARQSFQLDFPGIRFVNSNHGIVKVALRIGEGEESILLRLTESAQS